MTDRMKRGTSQPAAGGSPHQAVGTGEPAEHCRRRPGTVSEMVLPVRRAAVEVVPSHTGPGGGRGEAEAAQEPLLW